LPVVVVDVVVTFKMAKFVPPAGTLTMTLPPVKVEFLNTTVGGEVTEGETTDVRVTLLGRFDTLPKVIVEL